MDCDQKITLILELPHLIPVQWRREEKIFHLRQFETSIE